MLESTSKNNVSAVGTENVLLVTPNSVTSNEKVSKYAKKNFMRKVVKWCFEV